MAHINRIDKLSQRLNVFRKITTFVLFPASMFLMLPHAPCDFCLTKQWTFGALNTVWKLPKLLSSSNTDFSFSAVNVTQKRSLSCRFRRRDRFQHTCEQKCASLCFWWLRKNWKFQESFKLFLKRSFSSFIVKIYAAFSWKNTMNLKVIQNRNIICRNFWTKQVCMTSWLVVTIVIRFHPNDIISKKKCCYDLFHYGVCGKQQQMDLQPWEEFYSVCWKRFGYRGLIGLSN